MTSPEQERVDAYLDTINRLEPEIAHIDLTAAAASMAISLKRIADALEGQKGGYNLNDILYQIMERERYLP